MISVTVILAIAALSLIDMKSVSARPLIGRDSLVENCYCYDPKDTSAYCTKPLVATDLLAYVEDEDYDNPFHATDHYKFYCGQETL